VNYTLLRAELVNRRDLERGSPATVAEVAEIGAAVGTVPSIGHTIILMGNALDRYYTFDITASGASTPTRLSKTPTGCPGSTPRRLVDRRDVAADALPNVANVTTDRDLVASVLAVNRPELVRRYPQLLSTEIGPGFGRAWTGQNGGRYTVVNVNDFAIIVHLPTASLCPAPPSLYTSINSIPLFFVVDPAPTP